MKTIDRKGTLPGWVRGAIIGFVVSVVISVVATALFANLALNGKLEDRLAGTVVFIVRLISVAGGGLIGTGVSKEKNLTVVGCVSGAYLLTLLAVGIVLYDGSFNNFGSGLLSVLLGGVVAALIRLKPQKSNTHSRKRRR